jgi:hypothetical protein
MQPMIGVRWPFGATLDDRCGFVLAMRARISSTECDPSDEWLIVARWGAAGELLSIARTLVHAPADQPIPLGLAPRQTALAMQRNPFADVPARRFVFAQALPMGTAVAGRFLATQGEVRLRFDGEGPSLRGEGYCDSLGEWRLHATWVAWDDEFVQDRRS